MPMGIRRIKSEQGQAIDELRPGDNGAKAVDTLYKYGRRFPGGKPPQRDYATQAIPRSQPKSPSWESERADYRAPSRVPPMAAPDESQPQFAVDKTADHVDVPVSDWTRGGDCSHPHFDHSPPRGKERR
jgi:hypothetical protein